MSRSACIILAYLMAEKTIKLAEALQFMKKRHPAIGINGGFIKQLLLFEKTILK